MDTGSRTMPRPFIQIDDEVREMTDDEYAQYQLDQQTIIDVATAQAVKEATRAAALAKLGLTADEIAALFG